MWSWFATFSLVPQQGPFFDRRWGFGSVVSVRRFRRAAYLSTATAAKAKFGASVLFVSLVVVLLGASGASSASLVLPNKETSTPSVSRGIALDTRTGVMLPQLRLTTITYIAIMQNNTVPIATWRLLMLAPVGNQPIFLSSFLFFFFFLCGSPFLLINVPFFSLACEIKKRPSQNKKMTRAAHAAHAAHAPVAAIYLPPNGVEVHYVQTANMRRVLAELDRHKLELTHPRAYLTYDAYEIAMRSLVFCEWTDTETSPATTKYFGFVADDAASVFGPKSTAPETDTEFLVARGFRRFRETLAASINRQKTAIVAIDGAARRGTSEHAFLAFLASVALHDDPVADATLTPLECIARVALVSSHTENEKQRAMAALKKRTNASYTKDLYSFLAAQLCDLVLFFSVYGVTAVNFTSTAAFFAARLAGSAVGSAIGPLLIRGDGMACWLLLLIDIALSLVAVLVPVGGSIVTTMALVAGSSVVSEARSGCDSVVARFLSAIGSTFVRVVSGLIVSASYIENVESLVTATTRFLDTQSLFNLAGSIAIGVLFETLDGYIMHEIKKLGVNPFFVCFMRLACHIAASGVVGGFNEGLGTAYLRLLVPRWMHIARLYTPAIATGSVPTDSSDNVPSPIPESIQAQVPVTGPVPVLPTTLKRVAPNPIPASKTAVDDRGSTNTKRAPDMTMNRHVPMYSSHTSVPAGWKLGTPPTLDTGFLETRGSTHNLTSANANIVGNTVKFVPDATAPGASPTQVRPNAAPVSERPTATRAQSRPLVTPFQSVVRIENNAPILVVAPQRYATKMTNTELIKNQKMSNQLVPANVAWLATQLSNWRGYFRGPVDTAPKMDSATAKAAFGARNFI